MYQVVSDADDIMRVHDTQSGKLVFTFVSDSDFSPTKSLNEHACKIDNDANFKECISSPDLHKISYPNVSDNGQKYGVSHFYSCRFCGDTFSLFKIFRNHKYFCNAGFDADTSNSAQYSWSDENSFEYTDPNSQFDQDSFLNKFDLIPRHSKQLKSNKSINNNYNKHTPRTTYTTKLCYNFNSKDHLLAFSSLLGKIVHKYIPHHITYHYEDDWYTPKEPLWYEEYCSNRATLKQVIPYLRERTNLRVKSTATKGVRSYHMYSFNKRQRYLRYRFICTGLTRRGRSLKRLCKNCSITLPKLPIQIVRNVSAETSLKKVTNVKTTDISKKVFPTKKKFRRKVITLRDCFVRLEDASRNLCRRGYGCYYLRGTDIKVNCDDFPEFCKEIASGSSKKADSSPELIVLSSDDEDNDKDESSNPDFEFVDVEGEGEVMVSKRLEESLRMFSSCNVHHSNVSQHSVDSKDSKFSKSIQPTTHLFKCHACQDVEQLYHSRAAVHMQHHMSAIHNISVSDMFNHLVEHQQDFGSYFIIVVEAFPELSSSPSKCVNNNLTLSKVPFQKL